MLGRRKGKRKGFTLGEMLLVIVILASIIIFSVPAIFKSMEGARKKSFVMQARKIVNLAITKRQEDDILNKTDSAAGKPIMKDGQIEYYCYTFSSVGLEKAGKFKGTVAYFPNTKLWKIKIGDAAFETKDGYMALDQLVEVDGNYVNLVQRTSTDEELDAC